MPFYLKTEGDRHHVCDEKGELAEAVLKPGLYEVTIKKAGRTVQQNKLFWMWMGSFGLFWGVSKEQAHDMVLYALYRKKKRYPMSRKYYWHVPRTRDMTKEEMIDLLEKTEGIADLKKIQILKPKSYSDADIVAFYAKLSPWELKNNRPSPSDVGEGGSK